MNNWLRRLLLISYLLFTIGFLVKLTLVLSEQGRFKADIVDLLLKDGTSEGDILAEVKPYLAKNRRTLLFLVQGERKQEAQELLSDKLQQLGLGYSGVSRELFDTYGELLSSYQYVLPSHAWTKVLQSNDPVQEYKQLFLAALASGPLVHTDINVKEDPLLLTSFLKKEFLAVVEEQLLGNRGGATFSVELPASMLAGAAPEVISQRVGEVVEEVDAGLGTTTLWSGYSKFAASSATRLKGEVEVFSTLAFLFTIISTIIVFRSLRQLLLSGLVVLIGFVWGVAITIFFEGSIHLVTLGFGGGLMGVSVDYSLHYFCEQLVAPRSWGGSRIISRVLRPISLGMLTSAFVFVVLGVASFPGLRELSIFSCAGLFGAYLTVVLLFPACAGRGGGREGHRVLHYVVRAFSSLDRLYALFGKKRVYIGLCFLLAPGLLMLDGNDDIRSLQKADPLLLEESRRIGDAGGATGSTLFISVQGTDDEELRTRAQGVELALGMLQGEGVITSHLNPLALLPSKAQQAAFRAKLAEMIKKHGNRFHELFEDLGIEGRLPEASLIEKQEFLSLSSKEMVNVPFPLVMEKEGSVTSTVVVHGVKRRNEVQEVLGEQVGVHLVDQATVISELFGRYRQRSILLSGVAYLFVYLLFVYLYGWKTAMEVLGPSLLTTASVLALLGYSGILINFFHIVALIIVVGLSVDYNIFFYEESRHQQDDTRTSGAVATTVVLSTLSTFLAFGIHSFSSTFLLQSIGLSIGLGVIFATLFAPLAIHREAK